MLDIKHPESNLKHDNIYYNFIKSIRKMFKSAFIVFIFIGANSVTAQTLFWAKNFGSLQEDYGYSTTVDNLGNVYTIGRFTGTVDFDPGTGIVNLTSGGSADIFVHKMDALGNFIWARSFVGNMLDYGNHITLDSLGYVYTTGSYQGTVDFDPGEGTAYLTSAGISDVFVHKMDTSGNFVWVKSFGGIDNDEGATIRLDINGNIYTTGNFKGIVDFDPGIGTANLNSSGQNGIFIQKMDALGNFIWVKSLSGIKGYGHLDANGNVYTIGRFQGIVDFDPSTGIANLSSAGLTDVFIQKMDALGNFIWAKSFGGISEDNGLQIVIDGTGNVYSIGSFQETADFDPGPGTVNHTSVRDEDVFVQKMDASGNFIWTKTFGGLEQDRGFCIALDASGNIYSTGYFEETVDFDPGPGTANLTAKGTDVFIQKMDASGNFLWAKSFGDIGEDVAFSIFVDAIGNVYSTGYFEGTVDFDPGVGISNLTSIGDSDIFVHKISQGTTGIIKLGQGIQIKVYPNPSSDFVQISFKEVLNKVEISVTDLQGKQVFSKRLNQVSHEQIKLDWQAGIYFLKINTPTEQSVVKLIKE